MKTQLKRQELHQLYKVERGKKKIAPAMYLAGRMCYSRRVIIQKIILQNNKGDGGHGRAFCLGQFGSALCRAVIGFLLGFSYYVRLVQKSAPFRQLFSGHLGAGGLRGVFHPALGLCPGDPVGAGSL
ncbi:MAG: hypothetical protein LKE88_12425 [Acidaminococcus provencensis]|jgi:hypothetical protein|nr:hypothetical protein [Acidaminococcus provencensis]MCH4097414.1 hypothetical protein [Acidaminococcus provencensis]